MQLPEAWVGAAVGVRKFWGVGDRPPRQVPMATVRSPGPLRAVSSLCCQSSLLALPVVLPSAALPSLSCPSSSPSSPAPAGEPCKRSFRDPQGLLSHTTHSHAGSEKIAQLRALR